MSVAKFAFYCSCGSAMTGEVGPASRVTDLEAIFERTHSGDGHARTDARTARNARRREDRRASKVPA